MEDLLPGGAQHKQKKVHASSQEMTETLKTMSGDEFDAMFVNGVIEHHLMALMMAKYVDTEAPHEEIRSLAQKIIIDQTEEMLQLQKWAIEWGYDLEPGDPDKLRNMTAPLHDKTGAELEESFMKSMVMHHQSAIDMGQVATENAKHGELQSFSQKAIESQTKESEDMRRWATEWEYDISE